MWELYAMWTWMAAFVSASETARLGGGGDVRAVAALVTFGVVGIGAVGCWLGGKYADRWGRTLVTSAAMAISGCCCLVVGLVFGKPLWALLPLLAIWGVAVVADSPSSRLPQRARADAMSARRSHCRRVSGFS
jgi:predicted MFS family arabinose efflux permease